MNVLHASDLHAKRHAPGEELKKRRIAVKQPVSVQSVK
jgi:hypothetical protein